MPTVFNILGPLANPARVRRQVTGVADPSMAERMAQVLRANGTERALVVHGHDGLDELTTTTTSTVHELRDGEIRIYVVDPRTLGLGPATLDDLRGGDAATNAELADAVLGGDAGPAATSSCSTPPPAWWPPDTGRGSARRPGASPERRSTTARRPTR